MCNPLWLVVLRKPLGNLKEAPMVRWGTGNMLLPQKKGQALISQYPLVLVLISTSTGLSQNGGDSKFVVCL